MIKKDKDKNYFKPTIRTSNLFDIQIIEEVVERIKKI